METSLQEIDRLLDHAAGCDDATIGMLLASQRDALLRFVSIRLDRRLKPRLDAEDVVQDICVAAIERFPDYLRNHAFPFTVWLDHIARDCLSHCHRTHIQTKKRSVCTEARHDAINGCAACGSPVTLLLSVEEDPSCGCERRDLYKRVNELMNDLSPTDQEILRLRVLDAISAIDVATMLHITEVAVRHRKNRLLDWLHERLDDEPPEEGTPWVSHGGRRNHVEQR